jgi:hypothetical protein
LGSSSSQAAEGRPITDIFPDQTPNHKLIVHHRVMLGMSGSELWIDRAIPHPAVGKRSWTQSGRRQRTPLRFGQQERSQNQQTIGAAGNNADQRLM